MTRPPQPIRRGAKPLSFRPRLECLEDRSVPATFAVTTTLDVVDATDGKQSLREAISAANATPEADTILLPAGVFRIALPGAGEDSNATGDFDITGGVTIRGAGAGQTIIDGHQFDRVFDIRGTVASPFGVVLEKLQVRNGKVTDSGGGIQAGNANLTIRDVVIAGNQTTGNGGGVCNGSGTGNVTLVRATVARNLANGGGGGLEVGGSNSVLTIRNSIIQRNAAGSGGGIDADKVTVTSSTISRNSAAFRGGGISGSRVVLTSSTVIGNSADRSAGIAAFSSLTLNFCTVSGNSQAAPPTLFVTTTLDVVNPSDGKLSLREAITAANASPLPDTILLPAGVFRITRSGAGEDGNATGDFDITSPITIRGAGAGQTIIDGRQLDRAFDIRDTSSSPFGVELAQLQVRNGKVTDDGGGIRHVGNTKLTVRAAIVAGNEATGNGGGISNDPASGSLDLIHTTVARNVAGANGGGVFAQSPNLTSSTVSNNTAGGSGGGLFITGFAFLSISTVSDNSAATDGGGVCTPGSVILTNSTVSGNEATSGNGGGVFAGSGATLFVCTVSGNSAGGSGGGVFAKSGSLQDCTVVKNSAQTGGGAFFNGGFAFSVANSIVALNVIGVGGSGPDLAGDPFTSAGHNLIGTGGNSFTNGVNNDIVGTIAAPIDPLIGDLKNNGGPTKTHALLAGSPAIDAGDASTQGTDQRGKGFPRKKDGNGDGTVAADIGAFEK